MSSEQRLPRHVAIVMDGNGRWAKKRFLPRIAGHKAGLDAVRRIIEVAANKKIEILTLFAFSSENWKRPSQEIHNLMDLFTSALREEAKRLHGANIQLRFIGDVSRFSEKLQESMRQCEQLTACNSGLKLIIAVSYGGRWDITQAAQQLARKVLAGELNVDAINEDIFTSQLSMGDLAPPDLFIRTSGECRISNFLLWQLAYTELYFTDILWPDFDEAAFISALLHYETRQRRFGGTGELVEVEKYDSA